MAKVTLVSWTNKPLQVIHAMTQNMMGNIITDLDSIKEEEAIQTIRELQKTSLGGPLEYVDFTFQVEGVPRALTHQMVRTRVGAVYSQESLRFCAKTGEQFKYDIGKSVKTEEQLKAYHEAMKNAQQAYENLLKAGVETQDAGCCISNGDRTLAWSMMRRHVGMAEWVVYPESATLDDIITQMRKEIVEVHPYSRIACDLAAVITSVVRSIVTKMSS